MIVNRSVPADTVLPHVFYQNIADAIVWLTRSFGFSKPGLLPYMWVDEIDTIVARAAAYGGEVVEAPHLDSPGGEWIAMLRDPAGNVMGLYQEGQR